MHIIEKEEIKSQQRKRDKIQKRERQKQKK